MPIDYSKWEKLQLSSSDEDDNTDPRESNTGRACTDCITKLMVENDKLKNKVKVTDRLDNPNIDQSLSPNISRPAGELACYLPWAIPEDRPWLKKFTKIEDPYNLLDDIPIKQKIKQRALNTFTTDGFINEFGIQNCINLEHLQYDYDKKDLLDVIIKQIALDEEITNTKDLGVYFFIRDKINNMINDSMIINPSKAQPADLKFSISKYNNYFTELETDAWLDKSIVFHDWMLTMKKTVEKMSIKDTTKTLDAFLKLNSKPRDKKLTSNNKKRKRTRGKNKISTSNNLEFNVQLLTVTLTMLFKKFNFSDNEKNILKKCCSYLILSQGATAPDDPYGILKPLNPYDTLDERQNFRNKFGLNKSLQNQNQTNIDNFIDDFNLHHYAPKNVLLELQYWNNRCRPSDSSENPFKYQQKYLQIRETLFTKSQEEMFRYLSNYSNDQEAEAIIKSIICEYACVEFLHKEEDYLKSLEEIKEINYIKPANLFEDMMMRFESNMSSIMTRPKGLEMDETEITYAMISQYKYFYIKYMTYLVPPNYFTMH